jgi:glutathione S-transferase
MANYKLHFTPDAASLVVRVALAELDQPYDAVLLDRAAGPNDSIDYRNLHPLGLVPALETPDGPMFETVAILLWLADRHGGLAPAPQSPDRADFLKWLMFTNTSIHTTLLQLFYPERVAGPDCVPAVIAAARARMAEYLGILDLAVAANPAWASVGQPTILGHYIGMLVRWLQFGSTDEPTHFPVSDYPALHQMLTALEIAPAALAAARIEGLGANLYTRPDQGE